MAKSEAYSVALNEQARESFKMQITQKGVLFPDGTKYKPRNHHKYEDDHQYRAEGIKPIEPMTAHEIAEEDYESYFNDPSFVCEPKLDGVRCLIHMVDGKVLAFSRRISKRTGWYSENTDSLPQLYTFQIPLKGYTVLDGELIIPKRKFEDMSGMMNCLWTTAIERQNEIGYAVFYAFDILYYDGVDLERVPLRKRKDFLGRVVTGINSPFIVNVPSFNSTCLCYIPDEVYKECNANKAKYSHLFEDLSAPAFKTENGGGWQYLSKWGYYEFLVLQGGEGVMLKPISGRYFRKRTDNYLKVKKFLTRDVVVCGYGEPEREYKGKLPDTWEYYEDGEPVTKFYAKGLIGTVKFGVYTNAQGVLAWKQMSGEKNPVVHTIEGKTVLEIGETSGMDEDTRTALSENKDKFVGTVIEVKCNEVFSKTGRLRHPRFIRFRPDKNAKSCTLLAHMGL